jgi:hypothetical protein
VLVLIRYGPAPRDDQLVRDDQERCARHGVPSPALPPRVCQREEPAREHHGQVREQRHQDIAPVDAGEEGQVQQDQRRGQSPVNVARPEDLAEHVLQGIRDVVLVVRLDQMMREGGAAAGGLSEVGQGGDGGDEGG